MDGQRDKPVTVGGHQFITLTVNICVQHGGREAPRRAGLSAAAETCFTLPCENKRHVHNHSEKALKVMTEISEERRQDVNYPKHLKFRNNAAEGR